MKYILDGVSYTLPEKQIKTPYEIFYIDDIMPCCGKPILLFKGPRIGFCFDFKCSHCGEEWKICPPFFIQKI